LAKAKPPRVDHDGFAFFPTTMPATDIAGCRTGGLAFAQSNLEKHSALRQAASVALPVIHRASCSL
jgi:hypothetical protein